MAGSPLERLIGTWEFEPVLEGTIEGRLDSSPDRRDWTLDFPITYRELR